MHTVVSGREVESSCQSHQNVKWASAAVETSCVRAVSIKQQLKKPTTERVLLADIHVELICHFWEIGRLISSRV